MKMYWSVEYVLLDQYTMSRQVTVSKLIFSSNEIRLNLVVPMFHLNGIEHRFQKPKSRKFDFYDILFIITENISFLTTWGALIAFFMEVYTTLRFLK